jgi:hypothetical protein
MVEKSALVSLLPQHFVEKPSLLQLERHVIERAR